MVNVRSRWLAVLLLGCGACAHGDEDLLGEAAGPGEPDKADASLSPVSSDGGADGATGAANIDASIPLVDAPDAPDAPDAAAAKDANTVDTSAPVIVDAGVDAGSPLDPDLDLPAAGGVGCSSPGTEIGCPGISVCRIATATSGRCETCTNCGNLNASCSASDECDILFQCFMGRCTNFCHLSTPQECGNPTDCIDVGHVTMGVCLP